jgi:zinc protease
MSAAHRALAHLVLACAVAFAATVASDGARAMTKIQRVVSPGGLQAWLVQDATVPLVAMAFAFRGGAAQDPADKPGVASMAANLLDEGAGDLDSKAFHARLERRAIEMNFSVSRDRLQGRLRMLNEHRDEAFGLLKLAVTAPRFDAEPVERIRAQMLSGLRRESTEPNALAGHAFWAAAFPDHPYGHPTGGTLESLPTVTAADLAGYARRVLARDNLTIAVVGDIDAATLGRLLDDTFGSLPAKAELTPVADVAAAAPPKQVTVALDVPQTVMLFGGPGVKRNDPDFMAAYIANHILGGGSMSSRLYYEVREKKGLAYSVSQSLIWLDHSGVFAGSTATRADRADATLETVQAEIRRMAEHGPTQDELEKAKSYLNGSQMLALDTSTKLAGALVQYQLDGLGIDYLEKRAGIINAVTLEDTRRAAKRLWSDGLITVIVGRTHEAATAKPTPAPKQRSRVN